MSQFFLTAELISAIWNKMSNLNSHFLVKAVPSPQLIISFYSILQDCLMFPPPLCSWDWITTIMNNICFSLSFFRVKRFNVCCSAYKLFSLVPKIIEIRIVSSSCSSKLNYLISWRVTDSFVLWREAEGLRWLPTEGDLRRTCALSLARLQKRCYAFKVTYFFFV